MTTRIPAAMKWQSQSSADVAVLTARACGPGCGILNDKEAVASKVKGRRKYPAMG